jgi:hypothetical protein
MYSYFSRDGDGNVLYTTHHFSVVELEAMLIEVGFADTIVVHEIREASSRRPEEVANFLYASARRAS